MTDTNQTPDTRTLVRQIANDMVARQEYPSAEKVRKAISDVTGGALNPSTSTVQDEMKKWLGDTFWPSFQALSALSALGDAPNQLQRIYAEGFQRIVIQTMELAKLNWQSEREEYLRQIQGSTVAIDTLTADKEDLKASLTRAQQELADTNQAVEQIEQIHRQDLEAISCLQADVTRLTGELQAATQRQLDHERELASVRESERARYDEAIRAARSDANAVKVELDAQRQACKKLELALEKQLATISELTQRASRAESQLASAQDEITSLRERLSQAIAKLGSSKAAAEPKPAPRPAAPARKLGSPRLRKNTIKR